MGGHGGPTSLSEPWFHHSSLSDAGETVSLEDEEARHVSGARRLGVGDRIVLFDGAGRTASAELIEVSKRSVTARLIETADHASPLPAFHLASAVPKGERMATLLSMATQLGMSSFTPLSCQRSVVKTSDSSTGRWARICREACKQSRRPHLPTIEPPAEPIELAGGHRADGRPILALHPGGAPIAQYVTREEIASATALTLIVGPEGGFSDDEAKQLAEAGACLMDLGEGILRTETACVAGLAILGPLRS